MRTNTSVDQALLRFLEEIDSTGQATRPWGEAGRLLALCQRCGRFRGSDCVDFPQEAFRRLLIDVHFDCPRRRRLHDGESDA